ncbi:hypothetical protein [Leptospira wolffii]|uniref:hypothetical protein n=1 Tax=Leptospira wolffii TaxID=409998 RepID=UPI003CD0DE2F
MDTRYSAILSQGAFKNGLRIDVSNTDSLARSLLVSSFPTNRKEILNEVIADITAFISCGISRVHFRSKYDSCNGSLSML